MSILMEFAMFPTDKGESVSPYVSRIIKLFKENEYNYKLTPMGTVIETNTFREALDILEKSYNQLRTDCNRIYSSIKFDIREGSGNRLKQKIESIEKKIGGVNKWNNSTNYLTWGQ